MCCSFGESFLQLFQLTIGNNWNSVMYPNIVATNRWFALFFVLYHFCCTTILVAIITSVVIDGFQVSQEKEAQRKSQVAVMQRVAQRTPPVAVNVDDTAGDDGFALGMMSPLMNVVVRDWQNQIDDDLAVANGGTFLSEEELALMRQVLTTREAPSSSGHRGSIV